MCGLLKQGQGQCVHDDTGELCSAEAPAAALLCVSAHHLLAALLALLPSFLVLSVLLLWQRSIDGDQKLGQ